MAELTEFRIRVNGGKERIFASHTSIYSHAVMAAFGAFKLTYPCVVEIWVPNLVEAGYGPYFYRIADFVDQAGNEYACPAVLTISAPGRSQPVAPLEAGKGE